MEMIEKREREKKKNLTGGLHLMVVGIDDRI